MSVPDIEAVRDMNPEEIATLMEDSFDAEREYTLEEEKQWFKIFHIRRQKMAIDKPDIFAEGANVGIEYVTGDEDTIPYSSVGGTIVSAEEDMLVVDSETGPEEFRLDLNELQLDVDVVVPDQIDHEATSPGFLNKIKLTAPPWSSEHDGVAAGLTMEMMYSSEYEWVSEGVYEYPPEEFFDDG